MEIDQSLTKAEIKEKIFYLDLNLDRTFSFHVTDPSHRRSLMAERDALRRELRTKLWHLIPKRAYNGPAWVE